MSVLYSIRRKLGLVTANGYKKHLVSIGIEIGKHTKFFSSNISVDEQRPWMISIGDYCKITAGVSILQHDYSRSVLRRVYGDIVGESQKTIIGNNVFLGLNSTVLMGSIIGDNVIVGAGSVVSGTIPNNVVVAGCPARIVCTLDEFYEKRKKRCLNDAVTTFLAFEKKYKREPSIKEMGSFWPLFLEKKLSKLKENHIFTALSGDDENEIISFWINEYKPLFSSYDDFIAYAHSQAQSCETEPTCYEKR